MIVPVDASAAPARPKVALVLGSGGLNALAAIPLIEFLQSNQVRPDLLVGCSGGSLILTLLACGYTSKDMGEMFSRCLKPSLFRKDWLNIASMLGLRTKGFNKSLSVFSTVPVFRLIRSLVGDMRLEDLEVPLVLQATDFDTGEGVELDSGNLVEAVYASCAAYPFFHPIQIDGRWLFDGMFSAPMPILPAARRGVDIVIAMDFSEKLQSNPKTFIEAMVHLNKVLSKSVAQSQMLASIDLHGHEIVHVKVRFPSYIQIWETAAYERILAAGTQAVEEYGDEILAQIRGTTFSKAGPETLQAEPG
jgi:NTE family protein